MNCPNCHAENPDGNTYCTVCGSCLTQDNSTNQEQQNAYNTQQPYADPQQQPYATQQPYTPQQPQYQQPIVQNIIVPPVDEHMSVMGWVGRFCINLIPFVGPLIYFIMLFVWAFGDTPKKSLKTFAKANLLIIAVCVGIGLLVALGFIIFGASFVHTYGSYYY